MTEPSSEQEGLEALQEEIKNLVLNGLFDSDIKPGVTKPIQFVYPISVIDDIMQLVQQEIVKARIEEHQQLVDFLKSAHLYDQDSAMKLRYHIAGRLAALKKEAEYE